MSKNNGAFKVTQEDFFWHSTIHANNWDSALRSTDFNAVIHNSVASGSQRGFWHTWDSSGTEPYLGIHTSYSTNNTGYGNTVANQDITSSARVVVNQSGFSTSAPGYNTAKYGDGAYLMRAPNQPTRGASVIYRYVDGALTSDPLWPWPMEDRVVALTGNSATWEDDGLGNTGGIWKTLDGVYDTSTPTDPTVSLSLPGGNSVFEGGDTITVRISRLLEGVATTSGNLAGTWTIGGTAVNGTHYNTLVTNWQIDDGQSTEDIVITTTPDDDDVTGDLTIILTLDASANYTVQGGSVTIQWRNITRDGTVPTNPPLPGEAFPPPL